MMDPAATHFHNSPPPPKEEMETLPLTDGPIPTVPSSGTNGGDPLLHPLQPSPPLSPTDPTNTPIPPPLPPKPREDSDRLKITVSDPQKESDSSTASLVPGAGSFVSYLVTTRTRSTDFSVRRRFRDVVNLADRIAEAYRGFVVPPRPDKSVVESQVMQRQEFVEQRRAAIERYLCKLAEHPVVGGSDELRVFLQAVGRSPLPASTDVASRVLDGAVRLPRQLFGGGEAGGGYVGSPQDVAQPAKGGRDLLRMFKELRQSVANDWGGGKGCLVEEDKVFLERKERVLELEQLLSAASQQV